MAEDDTIANLREEMSAELAKYKEEVNKMISDKDEQIRRLTEDNKALNSELVRATLFTPSPQEEHILTEEEKRDQEWQRITDRTKQYMRQELRI